MESRVSSDLARSVLQLLFLGALITSSFWILRPFLAALLWATMIVVATWPILIALQGWMGGRRSPAVAVVTIALLLLLVVPLYFGIGAIVDNASAIPVWFKSLATMHLPPPPEWLAALPIVGGRAASAWQQVVAAGPEGLVTRLAPYAETLVVWFAAQVGGIGGLLVQFLLTVVVAAILYSNGEAAAAKVDQFARRLAGAQGEEAVHLAAQAIRGVALGVIVTALVQTTVVGLGLAIIPVPFASILTAIVFILCIAQLGPILVLIPVVIWVYSTSSALGVTICLIWALVCSVLDNFLRPMLIRRGADLPLLLIFAGVIGGLVAFGVIGLFIGPVVLAVAYTLLEEWVADGTPSQAMNQE